MKKIINGKKYDTDTAQLLTSWNNGLSTSDFSYCCESLYRKRTGEYFLYGKGGAMSKYSRSTDLNNWEGGEKIIPLTEEEAKKVAEEELNGDEYEAIFGEVEE